SMQPNFQIVEEQNFSFKIKIPFWNQPWFWIPLALLIGLTLLVIVNTREKRIKNVGRMKNQISEYKYELLRNQINPHFLFNSFNILAALIPRDPVSAGKFLDMLADFYREIVQVREQDLISVEQENTILSRYYYLLRERFGDALKVEMDVSEKSGFLIPF